MTTPGHQAGPTPADGGPAPGTGFPPREGVPEAGDARYGVPEAQDSRYGYRGEVSAGRRDARGRARPRHAADRARHPAPGRYEAGPPRYDEADRAADAAAGTEAAYHAEPAPHPGGAGTARATAEAEGAGSSSLLRSSGVMAMGTIASRVTGFVRSAILIYAIGTHDLGNAYNLANTIPNIVYNLALGGILTSVVVPLLVNAAKRDRDRGEAYDQRIFTLGVLALGGITVVATLAAQPIASLYASNIGSPAAYHLTVIFAYFFIPQIFFYGVSSLAGAILNAR